MAGLRALAGGLVFSAMALGAQAETSASYTLANSTGDYVSHGIDAGFDFKGSPFEVRLDATVANAGGTEVLNQYGLAASWRVAPLLAIKYRRSGVKDTVFNVNGQELGVSVHLDGFLGAKLETRLDFGAAVMDYGLKADLPALAGLVPDQRRHSFGIRQDVTQGLSLYATYEQYGYSLDPVAVARFRDDEKASPSLGPLSRQPAQAAGECGFFSGRFSGPCAQLWHELGGFGQAGSGCLVRPIRFRDCPAAADASGCRHLGRHVQS
jgi:hypothetical protein